MEIKKNGHDYIIERNDGTSVELTCNEVSLLVNFVGKEGLRAQIADRIDFAVDEDGLELDKYEGTREEFIDEIFVDLEDEVDKKFPISSDNRLETIAPIIEIFEDFLEDKGIVIKNDEKEESESPSNIYGTDWGNLCDRIEAYLVELGVLEEEK